MSTFDMDGLDSMQFDVLKEIGNIGAGNATTALSQMINSKVDMHVPKVELMDLKVLPEIVGGPETLVVGILLTLSGDVDGMIMFVLEQSSAHHLVNILLNKQLDAISEFSEMDFSALQEIGNIIAGAYLNSLSTLTNLFINASVPYMANDMAGAILSVPAIEFGKMGDKALLIQSQFCEDETRVNGYFILIPTIESYAKILKSLGL
ncbi:chemotaxis protein CheC -- inhibitor of MCP methylation [Lachnospiraceae bacterium KM106-2]|nr:chemotaxis protein CheC -- inhibitor of MCP methylation [Lachnospiraceae bacterium KM106-2]